MNLIKRGENQLLEANTLNGGQLRIGASDTICRYYLVPFFREFHLKYPNVHIKVANQTSIACAKMLENGQVDFIITNYPNSSLSNVQSIRSLREFSDVFVANPEHFPLGGRKIGLQELQTYPILMLDRKSTTSEFLHHMFQKNQLDLVPEIELTSNDHIGFNEPGDAFELGTHDLQIALARIGLGIAFVPDFCIPKDDKELFVLDLEETLPKRQIVVAHNENLPISQAAKQFMEMLR